MEEEGFMRLRSFAALLAIALATVVLTRTIGFTLAIAIVID